jgi:hypothetical protein
VGPVVRKWFTSEFTWRLYVVLQVAALIASAFILLAIFTDGKLIKYKAIYEEVNIDPVEVEAKCGHLSDDPNDAPENAFTRWNPELKISPRETCLNRETQPRVVGQEFAGVHPEAQTAGLLLFLLAFVLPFAVVRVPSWLGEGWRSGR